MPNLLRHIITRLFSATSRRADSLHQSESYLTAPGSGKAFIYCLVGNIIEERLDQSKHTMVKGTKHFSPGTKVYCFPPIWGDGYEKIKVIGRHRKSSKLVTMIMPSKHITNWRLKTVYDPFIVKQMTNHGGWSNKESDKEKITEMLSSLISLLEN
ncbi:hypothetical protein [Pseudoflavitalea rhizosphaerae]|uniref:hypothetical protein n=1 Tax=Pseudoflavitalea rhizosphaerae TaxID=1884793 RepID=UPI000F8D1E86|nr:hypothetical protein [Pseudoflavitalea rhizosphaerae]